MRGIGPKPSSVSKVCAGHVILWRKATRSEALHGIFVASKHFVNETLTKNSARVLVTPCDAPTHRLFASASWVGGAMQQGPCQAPGPVPRNEE